jgi:hypothetical protein
MIMMDFILVICATTIVLIAFACDSKWTWKYPQIHHHCITRGKCAKATVDKR